MRRPAQGFAAVLSRASHICPFLLDVARQNERVRPVCVIAQPAPGFTPSGRAVEGNGRTIIHRNFQKGRSGATRLRALKSGLNQRPANAGTPRGRQDRQRQYLHLIGDCTYQYKSERHGVLCRHPCLDTHSAEQAFKGGAVPDLSAIKASGMEAGEQFGGVRSGMDDIDPAQGMTPPGRAASGGRA